MADMRGFDPIRIWDHVCKQASDRELGDEAQTVALLRDLAGEGPALELGIGRRKAELDRDSRGHHQVEA